MHATVQINNPGSKHHIAVPNGLVDDNPQGQPKNILSAIPLARQKVLSPGEVLYYMGENNESAFYIQSGMSKLLTHLPDGKSRIVRLAARGDFIGFDCLIEGFQRHTAIAIDDMVVKQLPLASLRQLERSDPATFCRLLKEFYQHLVLADTWITKFSTGDIKGRIAYLLYFLSDIEFGKNSDCVALLRIQEVAETLGITPESASRTMADFKRKKILTKLPGPNGGIYRINMTKLQHETRV